MSFRRRQRKAAKDPTASYRAGSLEDEGADTTQHFGRRNKRAEQSKINRTTAERAATESQSDDMAALPIGEVTQVHSLYVTVEHNGQAYQCVRRKTLLRSSGTQIVVGDRVHFRPGSPAPSGPGAPNAVSDAAIEQILPRQTVLTRTDSFHSARQHPIVANAAQMLIVTSLRQPRIKWGLVDRMIVAAQGGGLRPIVCLNKMDAAEDETDAEAGLAALNHYASIGLATLATSVPRATGIEDLRHLLTGTTTVLAGHSGVGKSTLIRAIQPDLDIRIGLVSSQNEKGRHTTTSARRYALAGGGYVIDTPGVRHFGLWGVTADNLEGFFPDVAAGTAPEWRVQSMHRIAESLA
jgi:ribosome biogenesis GTPase